MTTHQFSQTVVRTLLSVAFLITILVSSINQAQAAGTFIPASARVDMVYDSDRDVVYISNGGSILRYHLGSNTFLSPFVTGGNLGGIDISPDNNTLVVADRRRLETVVWVYVINLQTDQITQLQFPRAFFEGGTYTVAFAGDGSVLSTSTFEGSGWIPLRKFNPITGDVTELTEVRHGSMVTASGDMGIIGIAEADISSGPFGRYRVADGNLLFTSFSGGTQWFNFEIGVNHNGTQYAIPTFNGTYIADENLAKFNLIGQNAGNHPIGVVYHPVENIVYFAWSGTTQIRAFDTFSFAQIDAYDFEHTFSWTGNSAFTQGRLKTSRDGSLLFSTVTDGVRFLRLYDPLIAFSQSVSTNEDTSVPITLTGNVGNNGAISFEITSSPSHGTLSGVAPNLVYTPDPNYFGPDSFSFKSVYGSARSAEATVSITVNPSGAPPIAQADAATTTRNTTVVVPVLANDSDPDGDPLTITTVTQGTNGTVTNNGTSVSYRPRSGFTGTDSFTYTVSDGDGGTATAIVTVTVNKK